MYDNLWKALVYFAVNEDLTINIARQQLRAMWTTFCICVDYEVDTGSYDIHLLQLWDKINNENPHRYFESFEQFDFYMCQLLV